MNTQSTSNQNSLPALIDTNNLRYYRKPKKGLAKLLEDSLGMIVFLFSSPKIKFVSFTVVGILLISAILVPWAIGGQIDSLALEEMDTTISNKEVIIESSVNQFYTITQSTGNKHYSTKTSKNLNQINLGKLEGKTTIEIGTYTEFLGYKHDFSPKKTVVFNRNYQIDGQIKANIKPITTSSGGNFEIELSGKNKDLIIKNNNEVIYEDLNPDNKCKATDKSDVKILSCKYEFDQTAIKQLKTNSFVEQKLKLIAFDRAGNSSLIYDQNIKLVKPLEASCTKPNSLNKGENIFVCSANNDTTLTIKINGKETLNKINLKAGENKTVNLNYDNGNFVNNYKFVDEFGFELIKDDNIKVSIIKDIKLVSTTVNFADGKSVGYYTNGSFKKTNSGVDINLTLESNYLDYFSYEVYVFDNKNSGEYIAASAPSKGLKLEAVKGQLLNYTMPLSGNNITVDQGSLKEVKLVFYSTQDNESVFECSVKQNSSNCVKSKKR
jgi:hypothetical protein